jgi:hypothetical protein
VLLSALTLQLHTPFGPARALADSGSLPSTTASQVYGQGGSFTSNGADVSASSLANSSGVVVDGSGGIYVADYNNNRVLHYPAGNTTADAVYGQGGSFTSSATNNGGVSASSLSNPEGMAVDGSGGLYVADYNNSRVLHFPYDASSGHASTTADAVYGQPDFTSTGRNNGGVSASRLSLPTGVAVDGSGGLYVADYANHRVLHFPYDASAGHASATADAVYGQGGSFTSTTINKGGVSASSLYFPSGVAVDGSGGLFVTDTNNNRVLHFPYDTAAQHASMTADAVYGQGGSFTSTTVNKGGVSASSLGRPHAVAVDGSGGLYVADYTNNRVLHYPAGSTTADAAYGQPNFTSGGANNGGVSASSLYFPLGAAVDGSGGLYVADLNNSRVLHFPYDTTVQHASTTPDAVYGQYNFTVSTSNGGGVSASSLSIPFGEAVDGNGGLYVADYRNNRVLHYPEGSNTADAVYGQGGSFTSSTANNGGVSASSLFNPTGVVVDGSGGLYVADNGNNRVLYFPYDASSGRASATADVVYGQGGSFTSTAANNGGVSASSLHGAWELAVDASGGLYVADTGNNRVLHFPAGSTTADAVYGQSGSFTSTTANNGGVSASSLSNPRGVAVDGTGGLYVTDYVNNRVLHFPAGSTTADAVYGQGGSFTSTTANNGGVSASSLYNPIGVTVDASGGLYVADSSNNRILHYPEGSNTADAVYGQGGSFTSSGSGTSASSLSTPFGMAVDASGGLYAADYSNNRVLYYAPPTPPTSTPTSTATATSTASDTTTPTNTATVTASDTDTATATDTPTDTDTPTATSTGTASPTATLTGTPTNTATSTGMPTSTPTYTVLSTTASAVYGQPDFTSQGYGTSATNLSQPAGVAVDGSGGLYVVDQGNNRVLHFPAGSTTADAVYGQPDFTSQGYGTSATNLSQPVGVAVDGSGGLYVVDQGNNRVLHFPYDAGSGHASTTADAVYGQPDFTSQGYGTSATNLNQPVGVAVAASGGLYVVDQGNNRALHFPYDASSGRASTTADAVYGQPDFTSQGYGTSATNLSQPVGVAVAASGGLYVVDQGNNRVLYFPYDASSGRASTTADAVYGQPGFTSQGYGTSATNLSQPSGVAVDGSGGLYVVDQGNNRALYYPPPASSATNTTTATLTPSNTATPTVTATATTTDTAMPADTATTTDTDTETTTDIPKDTATATAMDTATDTATDTGTATDTTTDTGTATDTATDSGTATGTATDTGTATNTATDTGTATNTATDTGTATNTATDTGTATDTATDSGTATDTATDTNTATNTATDTGTATDTATDTGTDTPVDTPTAPNTATATGTPTDTFTLTKTPTNTPTNTSTPTNTNTATPCPTSATTPDPTGHSATVVYGQCGSFTSGNPDYNGVSATSLYYPYFVATDGSGGLYVVDVANSRVLHFPAGSTTADAVYGQPDFTSYASGTSASSLAWPQEVATDGSGGIYVADENNNRVLHFPAGSTTADAVYGQGGSFTASTGNNGGVSASSLYTPFGVAVDASGDLYVADTSNNRVLHFPYNAELGHAGTTADAVYGQPNFTSTTANKGGVSASSLYHPTGVAVDASGGLYVADTINDRVLYFPYNSSTGRASITADTVYGQGGSFTSRTPNNGGVSATSLYSPVGLAPDDNGGLYVVDVANNRVLHFPAGSTTADAVYGQGGSFTASRSGTSATSLSNPEGVAVDASGDFYVADTSNNRVLYFPAPPAPPTTTPTMTNTPTNTPSDTPTSTVTFTRTPTNTPTSTHTPKPTNTVTPGGPTSTLTSTPSGTATPKPTGTATTSPTSTPTGPTATHTPKPTSTVTPGGPTSTLTSTPSGTATPKPTGTATTSPTSTPTGPTATHTPKPTSTVTPGGPTSTGTSTPTNTATASATGTNTPTGPTATHTPKPTSTVTPGGPTSTLTPTPSNTATASTTGTATVSPTSTPTGPTATHTPKPTNTATPTATVTASPTGTNTPVPPPP